MSGEAYPPDDSTYSDRDAPVPGLRTAPMIAIGHLTTRYRNIAAVDGLSFDSGPGRVAGLLGPNGAGRTTTLRMPLGLARPDGGTATINGACAPATAAAVLTACTVALLIAGWQAVLRRDVA